MSSRHLFLGCFCLSASLIEHGLLLSLVHRLLSLSIHFFRSSDSLLQTTDLCPISIGTHTVTMICRLLLITISLAGNVINILICLHGGQSHEHNVKHEPDRDDQQRENSDTKGIHGAKYSIFASPCKLIVCQNGSP